MESDDTECVSILEQFLQVTAAMDTCWLKPDKDGNILLHSAAFEFKAKGVLNG
jgi:hypothetical protein